MKFISSALLLILSAAITQSAVTPAKSDCQIVQEAYLQAGGNPAISNCNQIPWITYDDKQKVTDM